MEEKKNNEALQGGIALAVLAGIGYGIGFLAGKARKKALQKKAAVAAEKAAAERKPPEISE